MHNERGEEILDPTPVELPVNFRAPKTLNDRIKEIARYELSQSAASQGFDSFDDADDFDIPDDPVDPQSPWEENFDPEVPFVAAREAEIRHGAVADLDESKINAGMQKLHDIRRQNEIKAHEKKASASGSQKRMSEDEVEQQ